MAIQLACACGNSYALRDEFAGREVQCPTCGQVSAVPLIARRAQADSAFERDRFLLSQQILRVSQSYDVCDEHGRQILFIQRPAQVVGSMFALLIGLPTTIAFVGVGAACGMALSKSMGDAAAGVIGTALSALGLALGLSIIVMLYPKRHVIVYRDSQKLERLLTIRQEQKFALLKARFTLLDANEAPIASLQKHLLYDFFRKRWRCIDPSGVPICLAIEDSVILSLLRRVLGPLFGLLRTNFLILAGDGRDERLIGEFNRKLTLLDRYVLDLSADPQRTLDRRIAIALGVMLDTGERR